MGDITKAARKVYDLSHLDDKETIPLHLPLGKDALQVLREEIKELEKDADAFGSWSEGLSADSSA